MSEHVGRVRRLVSARVVDVELPAVAPGDSIRNVDVAQHVGTLALGDRVVVVITDDADARLVVIGRILA